MGAYKEQGRGMFEKAKGKVKEELGDATDNPRLEDEGRREQEVGRMRTDVSRASERMRGAGEEMEGSLKRGVGDLVDDERMESEGHLENTKGRLRRKLNE
jgi:uncharacterized protein YjbJ (UPF0337 family)